MIISSRQILINVSIMRANTTDQSKRWMPFQCPSCSALFRVQRFLTGRRGNCPTCQELIEVPLIESSRPSSSVVPELTSAPVTAPVNDTALLDNVARAQPMTAEEKAAYEARKAGRRKHYIGPSGSDGLVDWEKNDNEEKGGIPWLTVGLVAMAVTLFAAVGMHFAKNAPKDIPSAPGVVILDPEAQAILDQSLEVDANEAYKNEEGIDITVDAINRYSRFDLMALEASVKSFLKAETVTERLAFSRHSERVAPLMKKFYGGEKIEPEGFESMNKSEVSYRENFITVVVKTADFLNYPIAVELIPGKDGAKDRYVIDWESWIGHCEMKVEELHKLRPRKPFLLRVFVKQENYYNFSFKDDQKWRSYRLELRSDDQSLLGYAALNSEVDKTFADLRKNGGSVSYMVMARYPLKARAKNQVEITSVVNKGWLHEISPEKNKSKATKESDAPRK